MTKAEMRAEIKRVSASLSAGYIKASDEAIFQRVIALPEFSRAGRIFTYCSVGTEADTRALIKYCCKAGKAVALPRTEKGGRMTFAPLAVPLEELGKSAYGIPEPSASLPEAKPSQGDLIIVPALCFDKSGNRLGHGGGYYDRYLSGSSAVLVGLCREGLLQDSVPTEAHDVPVDILITESKTARPAGGLAK